MYLYGADQLVKVENRSKNMLLGAVRFTTLLVNNSTATHRIKLNYYFIQKS